MSRLYIAAVGDYIGRVPSDDIVTDLKSLVAETVGAPVRRIARFIQLVLIGAGRCAKSLSLPASTAVYLGSGRGDMELTIEVMQALFRDGHAPKPLSFINTVSNAACYYVAQSLKLTGRSSFVCNRYFAFESMLQLVMLDMQRGEIEHALVGTVDVVVPPVAAHRIRLGLGSDTDIADATHWVAVQSERSGALGEIRAAEHFVDVDALRVWLASQEMNSDWRLATGQFMPEPEAEAWARELRLESFDYRTGRAYYDSQSGAAINAYLNSGTGSTLLHLNRDPTGRYSAIVFAKDLG